MICLLHCLAIIFVYCRVLPDAPRLGSDLLSIEDQEYQAHQRKKRRRSYSDGSNTSGGTPESSPRHEEPQRKVLKPSSRVVRSGQDAIEHQKRIKSQVVSAKSNVHKNSLHKKLKKKILIQKSSNREVRIGKPV